MRVSHRPLLTAACSIALVLLIGCVGVMVHAEPPTTPHAASKVTGVVSRQFTADDSLAVKPETKTPTREALEKLTWDAGTFEIICTTDTSDQADASVLFPSPVRAANALAGNARSFTQSPPSNGSLLDQHNLSDQTTVPLLWYAARDQQGKAIEAPAVVIVHSIHINAAVAKGMARALRQKGVHAFVLFMPGFGPRAVAGGGDPSVMSVLRVRQAVAEIRRAYDVVAALPNIDERRIGLLAISLGTFAATAAQSLDGCYNSLILLLGGADLPSILREGKHDTQTLKRRLQIAGVAEEELLAQIGPIEPLLLAHRLDARRTWLISAERDMVIPTQNARKLSQVIGLSEQHHLWLPASHYTALILLPGVVEKAAEIVKREEELQAR